MFIQLQMHSSILGNPRIAMWCVSTMCVCDLCCTMWCGCCRSSLDRLPPLRVSPPSAPHNNSSAPHDQINRGRNGGHMVLGENVNPVHHNNDSSVANSFHTGASERSISPTQGNNGIPVFSSNENSVVYEQV